MQVGGLLHNAEALDGGGGGDDPADAQAGERDFCEAVDVDDEIRAIELLERWDPLFVGVQARVNMVFHDWNLMTGREFQDFAARRQWHRSAARVVEGGREDD